MQVLTVVEVAEHYWDNIVYQDNLLNIIELYQDITFSTDYHTALINSLLSCPLMLLNTRACIVLSFVKIMQPCWLIKSTSHAKQENLSDQKYLLPLKSCDNFYNFCVAI